MAKIDQKSLPGAKKSIFGESVFRPTPASRNGGSDLPESIQNRPKNQRNEKYRKIEQCVKRVGAETLKTRVFPRK